MWDFRTDVIPLLVLAALGGWSVWLGRGGSVRAKQMREQLNMPEKDEMERAIHHKSITAAYYAMLFVLGVYMPVHRMGQTGRDQQHCARCNSGSLRCADRGHGCPAVPQHKG